MLHASCHDASWYWLDLEPYQCKKLFFLVLSKYNSSAYGVVAGGGVMSFYSNPMLILIFFFLAPLLPRACVSMV